MPCFVAGWFEPGVWKSDFCGFDPGVEGIGGGRSFEHKTKWDLRRWRVQHEGAKELFWGVEKDENIFSSGSKYRFRALYPFYSTVNDKYFFDAHFVNVRPQEFEFNTIDYYFSIPSGEVSKSAYIDQQPNR